MAQASKITPTGTLYTAGILDEVTYNPNSGVKKNLLNYSQNFTTAYWSVLSQYASYVTNATLAPDGTNTATKLVESNQNNYHVFYTGSGIQAVAGQYYCNSIYVKAAERYMFAMYAGGSSNWTTPPSAVFNLQTGTVVSGSTNLPAFIKDVGNGWYRCSTQGIYANYTLGVSFNFGPCLPGATSTNNVVYQGDGTSGIYVWGAQQEFTTLGAGPTIYEPTGANAVPLPPFAARTDSAGNNYIANIYDEVTYNRISNPKNLIASSAFMGNFTNLTGSSGYWNIFSGIMIPTNNYIAPDGTATATLFTAQNTATNYPIIQTGTSTPTLGNTIALSPGQYYTASAYVNRQGFYGWSRPQNSSIAFVFNSTNAFGTFSFNRNAVDYPNTTAQGLPLTLTAITNTNTNGGSMRFTGTGNIVSTGTNIIWHLALAISQ